jgi:acetylornithine deacetylase
MTFKTTEEILNALVQFDTTSRESNLPLIDWVEAYLDGFEIPHLRVDYEGGRKTNLYATIGPDIAGGIVLSGHTDVVPVDGQDWTTAPFQLTPLAETLVARGSADMKGFIAVCLSMVPHFKSLPLKRPIHFAFSCDEEVGCRGVRPLLAHIRDHLKKPAMAIIGEPTSMQVVNAHKGATRFQTVVTGHEAHSALTDQGVNSIMVAGEIVHEITELREELISQGDPTGRFNPPYSTIHIGMISGGTAQNIVPKSCGFGWETRLLPTADREFVPQRIAQLQKKLEPAMKAVSTLAGISTERVNDVPGLRPEVDSPAENLALHCSHSNGTTTVSYCTEAGLFQEIGIPSVICGPGNIEQAHKADEFIAVDQLRQCETFMQRLAQTCR